MGPMEGLEANARSGSDTAPAAPVGASCFYRAVQPALRLGEQFGIPGDGPQCVVATSGAACLDVRLAVNFASVVVEKAQWFRRCGHVRPGAAEWCRAIRRSRGRRSG
jgi:hypothetical protein